MGSAPPKLGSFAATGAVRLSFSSYVSGEREHGVENTAQIDLTAFAKVPSSPDRLFLAGGEFGGRQAVEIQAERPDSVLSRRSLPHSLSWAGVAGLTSALLVTGGATFAGGKPVRLTCLGSCHRVEPG